MNKLTLTPEADVVSLDAARKLRRLNLPANGTFLAAAESLVEQGKPVTRSSLADALHEEQA